MFVIAFIPLKPSVRGQHNTERSNEQTEDATRRERAGGRAGSVSVVIVLQCARTPLKDAGRRIG